MAILRGLSCLNIIGTVNAQRLSPNTKYVVYFVYKLTDVTEGLDRVPVPVGVTFGNQPAGGRTVLLKTPVPVIREDGGWKDGDSDGEFHQKHKNDREVLMFDGIIKYVIRRVASLLNALNSVL